MLELKNVVKSYQTEDFTQTAVNDVSIRFRKTEFVSILGPSGSGKTTCLNIIGGLDKYDSGDLIINGKSTKTFKDKEWDAYRNNSVGFIFQNYYLIPHLSILDNVEMSMTLSGVLKKEKREKAINALMKVGLKDHIHKKPNQLSGGQQQRVAIARAIVNDPRIILADEPTGALDSKTSIQIMNLLSEIADDKLVIMVTHNPALAEKYSDRIIEFKDGKIIKDSHPFKENIGENAVYQLKRTNMSFKTALNLSWKNICTKKMRTALTSFASSIGIIGIALVLSISNGFQKQIDHFQSDAMAEFPIIISRNSLNIDENEMLEFQGEIKSEISDNKKYSDKKEVQLYDAKEVNKVHINEINQEYLDYLKNINSEICDSIGMTRMTGMNLMRMKDGKPIHVSMNYGMNLSQEEMMQSAGSLTSMKNAGLSSYPIVLDDDQSYLEKNYDLLAGTYPKEKTDLVLVVDNENRINYNVLKNLGYECKSNDTVSFDDIVGEKIKLIANDDYYQKNDTGGFVPATNLEDMYHSQNSADLNISGIVRLKEDVQAGVLGTGIAYSEELVDYVIEREKNSEIVKAQKEADYNVLTLEKMNEEEKNNVISYLGGEGEPAAVYLYPTDFESKEKIIDYLDEYNTGKSEEEVVVYSDLASSMTEMTSGIMDAITIVLVAFAGISLIVSLIMVGIITYISVIERTKEIGILRALGARKKDITRVFNAETFIIGITSGAIGIAVSWLLTFPVSHVLLNMTGLENIAQLNPVHAVILIIISVVLTLIGGAIPAKMAANKNPVNALRTE